MYAENPLVAHDTDIYDNNPLKKYGMLKGQVKKEFKKHISQFYNLNIPLPALTRQKVKNNVNILPPYFFK